MLSHATADDSAGRRLWDLYFQRPPTLPLAPAFLLL